MTDAAAQRARPATLADLAVPFPFFVLAAIGLVVGYSWFPAWFFAAQLLRIWSTSGAVRWLSSLGVPEYTDEKYAMIIGYTPVALIALRILLSLNWLEPVQILGKQHIQTGPNPEEAVFLGIVLGVSLATAMTGVLRAHGLPWLLAAAGFGVMLALVVGADGAIWQPNPLQALPLIILGYLVSKIPLTITGVLDRRAARREEEIAQGSQATT